MRVVGKRKRNKLRMEWMSFDIFRQTQLFLSVSKYNQSFNRQQFEKRNEPQQKKERRGFSIVVCFLAISRPPLLPLPMDM